MAQRSWADVIDILKSFVTIAATKAKDADGGLYSPEMGFRKHASESGARADICQIYVRLCPEDNLEQSPLLSRGWVFQERLLSSRFVHFGQTELEWEYNTMTTCECTNSHRGERFFPGSMLLKHERMGSGSSGHFHRWVDIVSRYSQLNLTFEKDTFPVLQGIASAIKQERGCQYFAGLWEDSLLKDLL